NGAPPLSLHDALPIYNVQAAPADADHELPLLDSRLSGVRFGSAVHDLLESIIGNAWPAPRETATTSQLADGAHTLRRYGLIRNRDRKSTRLNSSHVSS